MSRSSRALLGLLVVLTVALGVPLLTAAPASAGSYFGFNITIPATGTSGPADSYPETIEVSGEVPPLTDVTVALQGLGHSFPADIDVLLVAPTGQSVMLMSDAGGGNPGISQANIVFQDGAPAVPETGIQNGAIYSPTNYGTVDNLPAPAPAGPYGSTLSALNGIDPNGTWKLFVVDDEDGDTGVIGQWVLNITAQAALNISDATVDELDEGSTYATFTLQLSQPVSQGVSVDFLTRDGTARSPQDYASRAGTRVFFANGSLTKTISVPVVNDQIAEGDETFFVDLLDAHGATIVDGQGEGTIVDDDGPPAPVSLSIDDVSVIEGNSGTASATFTVSLSAPSDDAVAVDFATENGTATAPSDYQARQGTRVFLSGQTTKTITIKVNGETAQEPNESFFLALLDPEGATLADGTGLGTIVDDDRPTISINDKSVVEGGAGTTKTMSFTVTLSRAGTQNVTVAYATANGSAVAPGDYTAKSGTLTFTPGQVSKTVGIVIKGDATAECDEYFFVNLSNPTNATIADGQGVGTIATDDPSPCDG